MRAMPTSADRSSAASSVAAAIAPSEETAADAKKVLAAHRSVRAFYLSPKVGPIEYSGDNLKVRVEIAIFTYPDKALVGTFAVPLTQQGVSGKDTGSEDDLVKMAAERAMEKFPGVAERIQWGEKLGVDMERAFPATSCSSLIRVPTMFPGPRVPA